MFKKFLGTCMPGAISACRHNIKAPLPLRASRAPNAEGVESNSPGLPSLRGYPGSARRARQPCKGLTPRACHSHSPPGTRTHEPSKEYPRTRAASLPNPNGIEPPRNESSIESDHTYIAIPDINPKRTFRQNRFRNAARTRAPRLETKPCDGVFPARRCRRGRISLARNQQRIRRIRSATRTSLTWAISFSPMQRNCASPP